MFESWKFNWSWWYCCCYWWSCCCKLSWIICLSGQLVFIFIFIWLTPELHKTLIEKSAGDRWEGASRAESESEYRFTWQENKTEQFSTFYGISMNGQNSSVNTGEKTLNITLWRGEKGVNDVSEWKLGCSCANVERAWYDRLSSRAKNFNMI